MTNDIILESRGVGLQHIVEKIDCKDESNNVVRKVGPYICTLYKTTDIHESFAFPFIHFQ